MTHEMRVIVFVSVCVCVQKRGGKAFAVSNYILCYLFIHNEHITMCVCVDVENKIYNLCQQQLSHETYMSRI